MPALEIFSPSFVLRHTKVVSKNSQQLSRNRMRPDRKVLDEFADRRFERKVEVLWRVAVGKLKPREPLFVARPRGKGEFRNVKTLVMVFLLRNCEKRWKPHARVKTPATGDHSPDPLG